MRAKNPPRFATGSRCTGPAKIPALSRFAAHRLEKNENARCRARADRGLWRERCQRRISRKVGRRFLDVAREIWAVHRRRCKPARAPGWNTRLVASQRRPKTQRPCAIRIEVEKDRSERLAYCKTDRLQINR